MTLAAGTRLGAYEITGLLGAGGMGEVYRATDTKLGREIAIKTLPAALASDTDRLARFEREAKLLAALNHAHIASVYSLDEHEGVQYLAMELVEGETLEEELKQGALPTEDALRLALQIAEALEAAHEKGVVHRDLKPANVMVTRDGVVKVLDFGLAKAFSGNPSEASPLRSPALSAAMTQQGLILGTAGYMSPEQASGQATDQRADIWAFGVVLYEMLTGMPVFSGESVPHLLADVLKTDPDWNRLPKHLHPRLRLLLERCLAKRVRDRYHSIADVRVDIEHVLSDPKGLVQPPTEEAVGLRRSIGGRMAAGISLLVAGGLIAGAIVWQLRPAPSLRVTRFSLHLEGPLQPLSGAIALSPDGQRIVYAANDQLYSRRLDQDDAIAIPGSEQASNPFFSADGRSLAFFTGTQLKTVGLNGERPRVLANVSPQGIVGAWDTDDRIIFGQQAGAELSQVSAIGGEVERFAQLEDYILLGYPDVLPGGEWVLFAGARRRASDMEIVAQNVATGEHKIVVEHGTFPRYVPTGHLLFGRDATLYAVAFDPKRVEARGKAVPVVPGVTVDERNDIARYRVASNGTLIYVPQTDVDAGKAALVRVDRRGHRQRLSTELRNYTRPRVSPDGSRVAVEVSEADGSTQIYVMDLASGMATQLTFEGTENRGPVWTPDSRDVLFRSNRGDSTSIWRKAADGVGEAIHVIDGTDRLLATEVLPSGALLYQDQGEGGGLDILSFDLAGDGPATPFLATPANEFAARASPDGAWIAYLSDKTGGENWIYIRPYSSTGGGERTVAAILSAAPVWSRRGDEVFLLTSPGVALASAAVTSTATTLTPAKPERLFAFDADFEIRPNFAETAPYDVMPNGDLIAVLQRGSALEAAGASAAQPTIRVVLNWFEELKRLVPTE